LIIEQPELHLNPALQVRLAEFFIGMVRCGKQIIIETHSEHIVNAVRVLTAEDESGDLARQCSIYFLGITSGQPVVHALTIGADGGVAHWPRDFFGEAVELSRRLFKAQRRFKGGE
jgi:predicted ATPase